MQSIRTHGAIDLTLSGRPTSLGEGTARVELETHSKMAADDTGLVHGGFVFSAADHAAMLAVNHPNVVLGAAECRFVSPVRVGETVIADALVAKSEGKKRTIEIVATVTARVVLRGIFTAFVLDKHVLRQDEP